MVWVWISFSLAFYGVLLLHGSTKIICVCYRCLNMVNIWNLFAVPILMLINMVIKNFFFIFIIFVIVIVLSVWIFLSVLRACVRFIHFHAYGNHVIKKNSFHFHLLWFLLVHIIFVIFFVHYIFFHIHIFITYFGHCRSLINKYWLANSSHICFWLSRTVECLLFSLAQFIIGHFRPGFLICANYYYYFIGSY